MRESVSLNNAIIYNLDQLANYTNISTNLLFILFNSIDL